MKLISLLTYIYIYIYKFYKNITIKGGFTKPKPNIIVDAN